MKPSINFLSSYLNHIDTNPTLKVVIRVVSFDRAESVQLDLRGLGRAEVVRVYNPLPRTPMGGLFLGNLEPWCPIDILVEIKIPAEQRQLALFRLIWTDPESGCWNQSYESLPTPELRRGGAKAFQRLEQQLSQAV